MSKNSIGYKSLLKSVLDDLESEFYKHSIEPRRIVQAELAQLAGVSTATLSRWMRHYEVMSQLDIATLYAITEAVNVYAAKIDRRYDPMELIELVGWQDSNKIEGLPMAVGF